jgi:uncharacterized membrane protein
MKNGVFWVVTPCVSCKNLFFLLGCYAVWLRFLQEPHGVTQKTPVFIGICCCLITRIWVTLMITNSDQITLKCITVQVFWDDSSKSKFD